MRKSVSSHPFEPHPWRDLVLLVLLLTTVTLSLLTVSLLGVRILSAARAYVAGEGFYIKGQKDALIFLAHYVDTADERWWGGYQRSIAVPLADGRARRELLQEAPDEVLAAHHLVEGGNHPEDVEDLIWLFQFRDLLPEMQEAVAIWTEADALIENVDAIAQQMRFEMLKTPRDVGRIEELSRRLNALTPDVDRVGRTFSEAQGKAARRVGDLLLIGAVVLGLVIVLFGVGMAWWLLARLERKDAVFRAVIERSQDLVSLHRADGRVLFTNESALESVLGYRPEEVVDRDLRGLIHPADRPRVLEGFGRWVRGDVESRLESRWAHRDGGYRDLETGGGPLTFGDGRWVLLSSRDLTQRRTLEEKMLEMQRLEGMGRLAGNVAHDFNNLLTTIVAGGHLVRDGLASAGDARAASWVAEIDQVLAAADRGATLTRQLLAFARREKPTMQRVDLRDLVTRCEPLLRRLVTAPMHLDLHSGSRPVWILGDPSQLQQVLVNLVLNARDAISGHGHSVVVLVRRQVTKEGRAEAVLSVLDDGIGIAADHRGRVFEPFFTTKEAGEGTGLGLAICHGIVQQHGGSIVIESQRSGGTQGSMHLPLFEADSVAEGEDEVAS